MSAPSIAGHRNNVPKHPNVLHSYVGTRVSALVHPLQQRAQMSEEDLLSLLWLEMGQCTRRGGASHKRVTTQRQDGYMLPRAGGERYKTSASRCSCMGLAKTAKERLSGEHFAACSILHHDQHADGSLTVRAQQV